MRNRDSAMKSREIKKMYVNELEMKSKYLEAECWRLDHVLGCCAAKNLALHQCLKKERLYDAPTAKQESALLFLGNLPIAADQLDIYIGERKMQIVNGYLHSMFYSFTKEKCLGFILRCSFIWRVQANENLDVLDEEYDSSKDEVSSVSSYHPNTGNFDMPYGSSLSLQSIASRLSSNDFHNFQAGRTTVPSHVPLAQLSVSETIDDPGAVLIISKYLC